MTPSAASAKINAIYVGNHLLYHNELRKRKKYEIAIFVEFEFESWGIESWNLFTAGKQKLFPFIFVLSSDITCGSEYLLFTFLAFHTFFKLREQFRLKGGSGIEVPMTVLSHLYDSLFSFLRLFCFLVRLILWSLSFLDLIQLYFSLRSQRFGLLLLCDSRDRWRSY